MLNWISWNSYSIFAFEYRTYLNFSYFKADFLLKNGLLAKSFVNILVRNEVLLNNFISDI